MTLIDAGPLIALIDADDDHHQRCADSLEHIAGPFLTTWACFTEAMFNLGEEVGHGARNDLWDSVDTGKLMLYQHSVDELKRMRDLMNMYADAPMDLGDASLVAAADAQGFRRVFTIDGHFYAYRLADGGHFEVIPGPLPKR